MCKQCVSELRIAFAYKKKCEESDLKLRDYFREHLGGPYVKLEKMDMQPEELMDGSGLPIVQSFTITDTAPDSVQYFQGDGDSHDHFDDTFASPIDDGEVAASIQNAFDEARESKFDTFLSREEFGSHSATYDRKDVMQLIENYACAKSLPKAKRGKKNFTCDVCQGKFSRLDYLR